jgi:hypothetical protein
MQSTNVNSEQYPLHTFTTSDSQYINAVACGRLLHIAREVEALLADYKIDNVNALPEPFKNYYLKQVIWAAKEAEGRL